MTNEEWQSKTDDWRYGLRYAQGDVFIISKNTPDFVEGYQYACDHLEGLYYSAGATTGKSNT